MPGENLSAEDREKVRFWVDALLKGTYAVGAARELRSIAIRTRGAVRTRGSVTAPASTRFPAGTPVSDILKVLQVRHAPDVRKQVAAALGEWGGEDALKVLASLVLGSERDMDPSVRSAALDAIGMIGGPEALRILSDVRGSDDDPTVARFAGNLIEFIR